MSGSQELRDLYAKTERRTDRQPYFFKDETYLDRLLVPEIYVMPNFVIVVRAVLYIYESCVHGQIDRQTD